MRSRFLIGCLLIAQAAYSQSTYVWNGSADGDLNNTNNWQLYIDPDYYPTDELPSSGDVAVLAPPSGSNPSSGYITNGVNIQAHGADIDGGTYYSTIECFATYTIRDGDFYGDPAIQGYSVEGSVIGNIEGGRFYGSVIGDFDGTLQLYGHVSGGEFYNTAKFYGFFGESAQMEITGGTFYGTTVFARFATIAGPVTCLGPTTFENDQMEGWFGTIAANESGTPVFSNKVDCGENYGVQEVGVSQFYGDIDNGMNGFVYFRAVNGAEFHGGTANIKTDDFTAVITNDATVYVYGNGDHAENRMQVGSDGVTSPIEMSTNATLVITPDVAEWPLYVGGGNYRGHVRFRTWGEQDVFEHLGDDAKFSGQITMNHHWPRLWSSASDSVSDLQRLVFVNPEEETRFDLRTQAAWGGGGTITNSTGINGSAILGMP